MFFALLFLTSAVAFAISTVSGGGAGLLLLPILGIGLAAPQVAVALTLGSTISSLARISLFLRSVEWRVVRWFVPCSIPGALLGVWLLRDLSPLYLEAFLGLFLLSNLPLMFRCATDEPAKRASFPALAGVGFAAGCLSGLTGAVGLLFNRFYLRYGLSKEQVIATRAANEILLHLTKLGLYAAFDLVTTSALGSGALVGMASVAAVYAVRRLLPYLSEAAFRKLGYAAMVAAGAIMSVNACKGLAIEHEVTVGLHRIHHGLNLRLSGFGREAGVELRMGTAPTLHRLVPLERGD